jgi:hypothetical protein
MDALRPPPIGNANAIKLLQSVIFTGIESATVVYPKGLTKARLASLLGWLGPLIAVHATDPLPASPLYIAVTPEDMRLFGRPMFSSPFEIGRWKKGSYRASILDGGLRIRLVLELDGLGRIQLQSRLRLFDGNLRAVFDQVVQGGAGPVTRT